MSPSPPRTLSATTKALQFHFHSLWNRDCPRHRPRLWASSVLSSPWQPFRASPSLRDAGGGRTPTRRRPLLDRVAKRLSANQSSTGANRESALPLSTGGLGEHERIHADHLIRRRFSASGNRAIRIA